MQPLLRRDGQAAFLGDGDEIPEMTKIHIHTLQAWMPRNKVFFPEAFEAYSSLTGRIVQPSLRKPEIHDGRARQSRHGMANWDIISNGE
ncbi:hypothetical protein [Nguyenibacter sp. L1]|uniref:hypothetical protein n=1 Tax=Nguyenibacter sp. L1 TaxID=3049350 RepID=UPI002B45EC77|nr:hypothetical protein [Nguyenibacter sp. L1]WRH90111.1 hypothetical protein QN315_14255 [Nguyenibacter sp. L1]